MDMMRYGAPTMCSRDNVREARDRKSRSAKLRASRPAVICRGAKRSIPMIGESSSSSMKHRTLRPEAERGEA